MTLVEKLTIWNGGELRGAVTRLAKEVGATQGLVSMWTSGTMPGDKYAAKVCKVLGITKDELVALIRESKRAAGAPLQVREELARIESETGYRFLEIPHLGTVSASRFAFSFDLPPENFTTLGVKGRAGDRYAVLRISGDCMEPKIEDGDEVLIRQTSHVEDGTIAVVWFDGECTLKRVFRKADGVQLKADNPKYPAKVYPTNKIEVRAEVVKILKDPGRKP